MCIRDSSEALCVSTAPSPVQGTVFPRRYCGTKHWRDWWQGCFSGGISRISHPNWPKPWEIQTQKSCCFDLPIRRGWWGSKGHSHQALFQAFYSLGSVQNEFNLLSFHGGKKCFFFFSKWLQFRIWELRGNELRVVLRVSIINWVSIFCLFMMLKSC